MQNLKDSHTKELKNYVNELHNEYKRKKDEIKKVIIIFLID